MTAEFAVILPAVAVLAIVLCCLGRAVVVRIQCQDAARIIAHRATQQMQSDTASATAVAGELEQWADDMASQFAGSGADATLTAASGDWSADGMAGEGRGIDVRVRAAVVPDPLHVLPAAVEGQAFAWSP
ncbi:TadE/TadG family type IV pilus assembly protein [Pseudoscardovia suis]|uniref:TadE/TadG family type IV pilus assembly protein n=1 Tax=Pseudoscardovia suis TaxID=987063 RepID=UPI003F964005